MISVSDLQAIARARLEDADVLAENGRFDGAHYLCGYAVELTLKARIIRTLNWDGFPESRKEFEDFASFKTHKLDVLLKLSGQEAWVKSDLLQMWSAVADWNPESRYNPVGQIVESDLEAMLFAAGRLLDIL